MVSLAVYTILSTKQSANERSNSVTLTPILFDEPLSLVVRSTTTTIIVYHISYIHIYLISIQHHITMKLTIIATLIASASAFSINVNQVRQRWIRSLLRYPVELSGLVDGTHPAVVLSVCTYLVSDTAPFALLFYCLIMSIQYRSPKVPPLPELPPPLQLNQPWLPTLVTVNKCSTPTAPRAMPVV